MIRKSLIVIAFALIAALPHILFAKAKAPDIGSIQTYASENKKYCVEIKILGYPDKSPSMCTFRSGSKVLWSKQIPTTPGKVEISDNGKTIVLANWGWYDEGGYRSLSFYNDSGDLLKEISLGGKGEEDMVWIRSSAVSPDGLAYVMGSDGKKKARIFLCRCDPPRLQWSQECGFEDMAGLDISRQADSILVATYNYETSDMIFTILDRSGKSTWEKKVSKNFTWDVKNYVKLNDNGKDFEIYDKKRSKFIRYPLPALK